MKKGWNLLWIAILCLALTGCRTTEDPLIVEKPPAAAPEETVQPDEEAGGSITLPDVSLEDAILESDLEVENMGKLRLPYTGNQSSVRYVTSAAQLPADEQLKQYDEAYFQEHALLLVTETVSSGSVQVGIESISVNGKNAAVTLSHHMPGDVGTADMATWLLWAEVPAGLDHKWTVTNPALPSDTVSY